MKLDQTELEVLYQNGNSLSQIGQILGCSVHKVRYWMHKYRLPIRSRSDAMYRRLNPLGDPYKIKSRLSAKNLVLLGLGLGIYWGEGDKVSKGGIRVANSDPHLISRFRDFLLQICTFDPDRLSYSLVCFNNTNPDEALNYWSKSLNVSPEKFGKIVQVPSRGKGTYNHKSKYGVCTLYAGNIKLKKWIMDHFPSPDLSPR